MEINSLSTVVYYGIVYCLIYEILYIVRNGSMTFQVNAFSFVVSTVSGDSIAILIDQNIPN